MKRSLFDIGGETLSYRSRFRGIGNKGKIWLCEPGNTEEGQCMRIQIERRVGNSKVGNSKLKNDILWCCQGSCQRRPQKTRAKLQELKYSYRQNCKKG